MSPEKKQTLKLLKVDNWSVFLLQRLQLMFAKGDCCDLTLKFGDLQELKVHRLVLTTCTKYFEKGKDTSNIFKMPESLTYTLMLPIINFMYSGKLEFKPGLHDSLLNAAKILNMPILIQLLIAQKSPSDTKIKMVAKEEVKKLPVKLPTPQTETNHLSPPVNSMLSEKKLPFWKKRVYPLIKMPEKTEPEDPRPTRFELPTEETSSLMLNVPSFTEISYESEPVVPSPAEFSVPKEKQVGPVKRRVAPPPVSIKSQKLTESQIISGNWSDEDDDHFESIHTFEDSDDDQQPLPDTPEHTISSTPKPILKPPSEQPPPSSSKRVRFCLAKEDKENSEKIASASTFAPTKTTTEPQVIKKVEPQTTTDQKENPKEEIVPNHAKIIAEVLKKFPDLVKNHKNIKLKITPPSGGNAVSFGGNKILQQAPKSSCVVVKPYMVKVDAPPAAQPCPEAENTTGPWICKRCTIDSKNLMFESYFLFRKHLTELHMEKIDPKICELCGYKASKKNLHLFHMYTKHNIQPPKNIIFPKCSLCKYVALSDSLLSKHYSTHQIANKELICNICKLSFKSASSFQAHCVTCKPNSEARVYPCKSCNRVFRTTVSMKAHYKDCRGPVETSTQLVNQNIEPVEMIEVPYMDNLGPDQKEHSLVQLPSGIIVTDTPNMTLLHQDGNGLNNVASAIPNLGFTVLPEDHQTVILLDENSEFFLQGNNSVVVTSDHSDEYVVPEILQDNMAQLYSTSNISYTMNGTSVITYPVVHMPQDGSMTDHSDNSLTSIPVSQNNDIFVPNKEVDIGSNLADIKQRMEEPKMEGITDTAGKEEPLGVAPRTEVMTEESVTTTTCVVGLNDEMGLVPTDGVCLVDSNTPISIMDPDGTLTETAPVNIVDTESPVNIVGTDNTVHIINSSKILDSKSTVISVTPRHDKMMVRPSQADSAKFEQISTEWDFEAEEEDSEVIDDPDSKPSRPSIELQDIV